MSRTRWILLLALLATLTAAWFAPEPASEEGVALVPARRAPEPQVGARVSVSDSQNPQVLSIRSRRDEDDADALSDLFAAPPWTKPARPVAPIKAVAPEVAPEPPAPSAPPVPFSIMGSMEEGGKRAYFLQYADQSFVARVGDTLLEQYKVESVESDRLLLRYLPMDVLQTLELARQP
ncbi:hypothetical protein J2W49_004717 [Hydrogenophaga palleronii]|uniref:Secretion system X translation initiation factor n=1 Tax=Hydrogenophaga palleronii TaxID=65655 RepID=A0ABU1WUJ4_9BURK|nr:hypothetical protein [Hydrogenophaga palleronii]MDR7152739.1 hypothetical protein [Hydrogenophaga palleronii]